MAGLIDRGRPTLRSVADLAGVSPATVSLILNNVPGARLSAQTRTRVLAAAEQLGYRPNALARSLRTARSQTIGLVFGSLTGRPGAAALIAGVQARAWQDDCMVMLAAGAGTAEAALVERLLGRQVEGIIYAAGTGPRAIVPTQLHSVPTVLVGCGVADRSLPSVMTDDTGDGFTATKAMIDAGHWRIACLGPAADAVAAARLEGYRNALGASGLAAETDLMGADAAQQTQHVMDLRQPPTAIICLDAPAALGCYDALKQRRLRVPEDVAVVAFDDTGLAATLSPPLSAVARPYEEMGRWAVDQLLQADPDHPLPAAAQVRLPGTLVRRQSF